MNLTWIDAITWSWLSEDNFLVDFGSPTDSKVVNIFHRLESAFQQTCPEWLIDYRFAFGKLSLIVRPNLVRAEEILDWVNVELSGTPSDKSENSPIIVIEACYDPRVAPDLISVSSRLGLTPNEFIQIHSNRIYKVLAMGFVAGFGYLGEIDPRLHLPRKNVPMTRIPAGSLAVAENQTAIYPVETPGGWHLIGRVSKSIVSVTEYSIHTVFSVGRAVRFEPISYKNFCKWVSDD